MTTRKAEKSQELRDFRKKPSTIEVTRKRLRQAADFIEEYLDDADDAESLWIAHSELIEAGNAIARLQKTVLSAVRATTVDELYVSRDHEKCCDDIRESFGV